jgi:hypothetical protein
MIELIIYSIILIIFIIIFDWLCKKSVLAIQEAR